MISFEYGEGTHHQARGSDMWFKTLGATTHGRLSLMERILPPGGRTPPPHRHLDHEEAYFVLDGVVDIHVGDEVLGARSGTFVLVPAGDVHTIGNTSDESARLLVLHAPALDEYFSELEEIWSHEEPPAHEVELELMRRHGMEPA